MEYKQLFRCIHGSHLYGMSTPDSDTDYKGIFMPKIDELLLGTSPKQLHSTSGHNLSKNGAGDIDEDWYSLPEFIKLACQGETITLDMLHSNTHPDCILRESAIWRFLVENKHRFYSRDMKALVGYARKQASKYGIKGSRMAALEEVNDFLNSQLKDHSRLIGVWDKLPVNDYCKFVKANLQSGEEQVFYEVLGSKFQNTMPYETFQHAITQRWNSYGSRALAAKNNMGVDWKAVSHAIRAAYQLKEVYLEGGITYPLKEREELLAIKLGQKDFLTEVQPLLEELIEEVEVLANESDYPFKVDTKFWDNWLLEVYNGKYEYADMTPQEIIRKRAQKLNW